MLVGNHDIYYKNISDVNSLRELIGTKHNNIHIYEDATEVDFDGLPILLMPWITQANELYAEEVRKNKYFAAFVKDYRQTKTFTEVFHTCVYLKDYVNGK